MPRLEVASVRRPGQQPMAFQATADARPVTLIPVARAHHQHYTVYWQTAGPAPPPAPAPAGSDMGGTVTAGGGAGGAAGTGGGRRARARRLSPPACRPPRAAPS